MNVSKHDQAIIEQALRIASQNSTDYQEIEQYESVLKKMDSDDSKNDGFRYDYDDSSL
ncbi:hypothetical protein [Bacillus weihaiensis]|uniref:hypothetical protein n=1 Tax=Bacillus weihaiensis TaxID=1547283 RepID=UPI0023543D3C|nr:hypothetical protein [Bacillus weihaiensis]